MSWVLVRTVRVWAVVDHGTYSKLKEVEEEYREVLEDAINYGLSNKTTSFTRIKAGIYGAERERHRTCRHITSTRHVRMHQ
ncbi:hypothetical protein [Vulcanisaeta sp. JCM 16161]|uniref:hypothetical protein n=1 Tax=Vulcanisaeta sp. JCM 16161 TaxID=1295372 RepID=UPI000A8A5778|nr:hypothetical protein [Vulcanisaeta sp. JCM 16161]